MTQDLEKDWDESKTLDDIDFDQSDADSFRQLLGDSPSSIGASIDDLTPGTILKGCIVEITKDFVVAIPLLIYQLTHRDTYQRCMDPVPLLSAVPSQYPSQT